MASTRSHVYVRHIPLTTFDTRTNIQLQAVYQPTPLSSLASTLCPTPMSSKTSSPTSPTSTNSTNPSSPTCNATPNPLMAGKTASPPLTAGSLMACTSASCAPAAAPRVRATGGTASSTSARPSYCRATDGWLIAETSGRRRGRRPWTTI
jgi:hypothetical protein